MKPEIRDTFGSVSDNSRVAAVPYGSAVLYVSYLSLVDPPPWNVPKTFSTTLSNVTAATINAFFVRNCLWTEIRSYQLRVDALERRGSYSATSNNMKLVDSGRWWVGCYIWYSEEGTWRGCMRCGQHCGVVRRITEWSTYQAFIFCQKKLHVAVLSTRKCLMSRSFSVINPVLVAALLLFTLLLARNI